MRVNPTIVSLIISLMYIISHSIAGWFASGVIAQHIECAESIDVIYFWHIPFQYKELLLLLLIIINDLAISWSARVAKS